jgi:hypothetical protein
MKKQNTSQEEDIRADYDPERVRVGSRTAPGHSPAWIPNTCLRICAHPGSKGGAGSTLPNPRVSRR